MVMVKDRIHAEHIAQVVRKVGQEGPWPVVAERWQTPPRQCAGEALTHASGDTPEAFGTAPDVVKRLVPQPGFELGTHALRMRCSTN